MLSRSCINIPHVKLIEVPSGKSQDMLSEQQVGGRRQAPDCGRKDIQAGTDAEPRSHAMRRHQNP